MQCHAGYFSWVKDAEFEHVAVGPVGCVVAVVTFASKNRVHNHAWLVATVGNDFAQWGLNGLHDQLDACILISVVALERANRLTCAQQCYAAASHNAFFNGGTGCVQRVFNAGFFLFHFDFGRSADFDQCNTAGQLGYALLQFFFVVIAGCFFDLFADLRNATFDAVFFASAVNDRGVFFAHFNFFR